MSAKIIDFQKLFENRIFNARIVNKEFPQHVSVSTQPFGTWKKQNEADPGEAVKKHRSLLKELLDWQIKSDLPILTINLPQTIEEYERYLKQFLDALSEDRLVNDNQVRIFVVGKWYNLAPSIVDSIKAVMNKTKDYDKFFLNLCVQYDGQDEIVSSLKLMARKIEAEKVQLDDITKEMIKDNLFTSYFLPPQVMIETGNQFSGLLLWDSQGAAIHFTGKHWLDFEKKELETGIQKYQSVQKNKVKDEEKNDNA